MHLVQDAKEEPDTMYACHSTREAHIEILEQRNTELTNRLESLVSQQEELDRSHIAQSRHLEHQIETLQHCLNSAICTIQEQQQRKKPQKTNTKTSNMCCMRTVLEMEQLKIEFDHMSQLKSQKEKKLNETRHDLCVVQQQCEQNGQEYEKLQRTVEAQNLHVQELESSVQQYDAILTKLQQRGVDQSEVMSYYTIEDQVSGLNQLLLGNNSVSDYDVQSEEDEQPQAALVVPVNNTLISTLYFFWRWLVFTVVMTLSILKSIKQYIKVLQ